LAALLLQLIAFLKTYVFDQIRFAVELDLFDTFRYPSTADIALAVCVMALNDRAFAGTALLATSDYYIRAS